MTKWLADTVQEGQNVGDLSMSSIAYCLAAINAWIIYRGVTGEEMSRHAFLRQLAEELRRYTKRNVNLWFQITTKKSSRRTIEKQAERTSVK